jgi:hypothetical protein
MLSIRLKMPHSIVLTRFFVYKQRERHLLCRSVVLFHTVRHRLLGSMPSDLYKVSLTVVIVQPESVDVALLLCVHQRRHDPEHVLRYHRMFIEVWCVAVCLVT